MAQKPVYDRRKSAQVEDVEHRKKFRMRIVISVAVVLVCALLVTLGILAMQIQQESEKTATQFAGGTSTESYKAATKDPKITSKVTQIPKLTSLIGKSRKAALAALPDGAKVTKTEDHESGKNAQILTVVLTEEPSDVQAGSPTVYLGLDSTGTVRMAGFSSPLGNLGYGSLSFKEAVVEKEVIQHCFTEAGLKVSSKDIKLPKDESDYRKYSSDGNTLNEEQYSFNGIGSADGTRFDWSAVLDYDYSYANTTSDLANTIRRVYVYVEK